MGSSGYSLRRDCAIMMRLEESSNGEVPRWGQDQISSSHQSASEWTCYMDSDFVSVCDSENLLIWIIVGHIR